MGWVGNRYSLTQVDAIVQEGVFHPSPHGQCLRNLLNQIPIAECGKVCGYPGAPLQDRTQKAVSFLTLAKKLGMTRVRRLGYRLQYTAWLVEGEGGGVNKPLA